YIIIFFLLYLIFCSFFNVVYSRTTKNITFIHYPSHSPHCNETLRWHELIPLLSFLWQQGTCKNCQARISPMYPIIELITGILFVYSYFQIGFQIELITAFL